MHWGCGSRGLFMPMRGDRLRSTVKVKGLLKPIDLAAPQGLEQNLH